MAVGAGEAAALVDDEEDVCRLCFAAQVPISRDNQHPNQIDDEGFIRLEEIGWDDLASRGFSLVRRHLYSVSRGEAEAARRDEKRRAKGQEARYQLAGALIVRAANIKAIADDNGAQVFNVFATPTAEEEAHAEIKFAQVIPRNQFLRFRQALRVELGTLQEKTALDSVA